MLLVHSDDLGMVGYSRAVRDGILVPLTATTAAPADIPVTQGVRARAVAPLIPDGAVVTGLAGLWLGGAAPFPKTIDVLRRTGTHRAPRRLQTQSRIHIHAGDPGPAPVRAIDALRVASPARCSVDALRWAPLGPAITAVWDALRSGLIDTPEVDAALAATPADRTRRRAYDAWDAVLGCWWETEGEISPRQAA